VVAGGLSFIVCSSKPSEPELALDDLIAVAYDIWDSTLRDVWHDRKHLETTVNITFVVHEEGLIETSNDDFIASLDRSTGTSPLSA
jgi:hypothetical protein